MLGDCLDGESAADPAEIAAIEQIGVPVLPERKDQGLIAPLGGDVKWKRMGSTEVGIARVESLPVRRGKEIPFVVGSMQTRGEPQDRLAVAPSRGVKRVAGRYE